MSIILKGINIPKNGDCHHITIYDNGNTYMTTSNVLYETERKDVEAIQIPKGHGILIEERYPGELQARTPEGLFIMYRSADKDPDRFILEMEE